MDRPALVVHPQAARELLPLLIGLARVVFATANAAGVIPARRTGGGDSAGSGSLFDVGLIDECCQMREAECLIPLRLCRRAVLIGDPEQLGATVIYHGPKRAAVARSLFVRCLDGQRGFFALCPLPSLSRTTVAHF